MGGFTNGLFFGGTEAIEPNDREDSIFNGQEPDTFLADDSDADEDITYENPHTGEVTTLKRAASPNHAGRPTKSTRVVGGKAAIPKRIVADYDSDDGRIITLKQQGYSDQYVAQKLVQEGRIRYVPKTVGSRWLRLRKALEQAENDRLDDELSDWHIGEDAELHEAVKAIDQKFEREMRKVMEKKWKEVATHLAERLQKKKYTANACRERLEGLQNGTALPPIEIDGDKEGRMKFREKRIAAAKCRRIEHAAEAQRIEDEKKARFEERKAEAAERERERSLRMTQREEERTEEERMKKERAEEKERMRLAKNAAAAQTSAMNKWEKERRKAEKELYAKLTGKQLRGPRTSLPGLDATGSSDESTAEDADDEDAGEQSDDEGEEEPEDDDNESTKSDSKKKRKPKTKAQISKDTLLNPRSIMTEAELMILLVERGLPRRTTREPHPLTVARICAADEDLSTTEVNDLLGQYFDKGKGKGTDKILRLAEYEAGKSAAADKGINVSDPEFKKAYEGYTGQYSSLI